MSYYYCFRIRGYFPKVDAASQIADDKKQKENDGDSEDDDKDKEISESEEDGKKKKKKEKIGFRDRKVTFSLQNGMLLMLMRKLNTCLAFPLKGIY